MPEPQWATDARVIRNLEEKLSKLQSERDTIKSLLGLPQDWDGSLADILKEQKLNCMKMAKEEIDYHRKADAQIQMMDDLAKWLPTNMHGSDAEIAERVEEKFGIYAEKILERFGQNIPESTYEAIVS